jgi:hypothetical protein
MQMRELVGKSRHTVFFQWFVAPEGRKVGSLKRRVRSHLARREMKNCTLLWREAHFQVKMYKAHQCRTTLRSCDVEKVHGGAKRVSKSKSTKHHMCAPLLDVEASQAQGIVHQVKSEQNVRVLWWRGTFKEDLGRNKCSPQVWTSHILKIVVACVSRLVSQVLITSVLFVVHITYPIISAS